MSFQNKANQISSNFMEQNKSFCASDSGLHYEDPEEPAPAKRLKLTSAKLLEEDA